MLAQVMLKTMCPTKTKGNAQDRRIKEIKIASISLGILLLLAEIIRTTSILDMFSGLALNLKLIYGSVYVREMVLLYYLQYIMLNCSLLLLKQTM